MLLPSVVYCEPELRPTPRLFDPVVTATKELVPKAWLLCPEVQLPKLALPKADDEEAEEANAILPEPYAVFVLPVVRFRRQLRPYPALLVPEIVVELPKTRFVSPKSKVRLPEVPTNLAVELAVRTFIVPPRGVATPELPVSVCTSPVADALKSIVVGFMVIEIVLSEDTGTLPSNEYDPSKYTSPGFEIFKALEGDPILYPTLLSRFLEAL